MIPQGMASKLKRSLVKHEDIRKFPYTDSVGKVTIGIGYNLTDRGIDDEWINKQYLDDVGFFYESLLQLPWFRNLNEDRQIVLVDMCFMGLKRFLEFKDMIAALSFSNYSLAAKCMLESEWAEQVKDRAVELARAMESGAYDI